MVASVTDETKTKNFFYKIYRNSFLMGSKNYWFEPLTFPPSFISVYVIIRKLSMLLISVFILSELLAYIMEKNLSEKQSYDHLLFSLSHPLFFSVAVAFDYYSEEIQKNIQSTVVGLKKVFNDEAIEREMIRKAKTHSIIFGFFIVLSVVSYGLDGLTEVLLKDGVFTTVITVWPNKEDSTQLAGAVRITTYIIWWIFVIRFSASFLIVIPTTICLAKQYKIVCSYFYNLNEIFDKNISQEEKEEEYEAAFKVGIQLHSDTLRCTRQNHNIFHLLYGSQVLVNVSALVILLLQMVNSDRTLANILPIVFTGGCVLFTTGILMWDAGDITVEASKVPTAMFSSGWHHCGRHSSKRIRQLLFIAISVGQKPVILRAIGVITLSYESYLTIVKSSYSIFSVVY